MTAGNVPVIAAHYGETSQDMAVHWPGKGQETKICVVPTKVLFDTGLEMWNEQFA